MKENERILEEFKRMGAEQLLPMLGTGQVTLLSEEGSKIKGVMSAHLVKATEDAAWKVLLDYDKYRRFLPGMTTSKVLSKKENEIVVKFVVGVKVMGIGGSVRYTYRFDVDRPYADVYDVETSDMAGYWAILPTNNKNEVILAHADIAKDVRSMHLFLRFLIDKLPTAEIGLHVSPVVMLVNRMKQRMEQTPVKS